MNPLTCLFLAAFVELGAASVFGQGWVVFANNVQFATPADRLVRDVQGNPLVGTNFAAQLYYGALGAAEGSLTFVLNPPASFRSPSTSQPGTWNSGAFPDPILYGFNIGDTVTLQVRVWDTASGPRWEDAAAINFDGTQYGASSLFTYVIPPANSCATCYYMENLRGFMLVPEPSVIVLGVLGAGGLLLLRRRK